MLCFVLDNKKNSPVAFSWSVVTWFMFFTSGTSSCGSSWQTKFIIRKVKIWFILLNTPQEIISVEHFPARSYAFYSRVHNKTVHLLLEGNLLSLSHPQQLCSQRRALHVGGSVHRTDSSQVEAARCRCCCWGQMCCIHPSVFLLVREPNHFLYPL